MTPPPAIHSPPQADAPLADAIDKLTAQVAQQAVRMQPVQWVPMLHQQLDQLMNQATAAGAPVACKTGCSMCCHAPVEVSPPEAQALAHALMAQLSGESLQQFKALLHQAAEQQHGAEGLEWAQRPPCVFLSHGQCSIYPLRPSTCRKAHSLDVQACLSGQAVVPQHYATVLAAEAWMKGSAQAWAEQGEVGPPLWLPQALLKAFADIQAV